MDKNNYVWYACYGSNLSRERFLCYIKGGQPKNSTRTEIGCTDKTLPVSDSIYQLNRPLYFAKNAAHWNNGGAGFIGLNPEPENFTFSRKYLITKQQFIELVNQENRTSGIKIDFEEVINLKSKVICEGRYGNLLFLENFEEIPVFSFTINEKMGDSEFVKPDPIYLKTIIAGLNEIYKLSNSEYVDYLLRKPGILNNYSKKELLALFD